MDSYWNRANALFCTAVTVIGCAALANHGTSYFYPLNPTAGVALEKVHEFTVNNHLKADQATLGFHLDADLRTAMQWNTKQLFTYLIATYSTQKNPRNEVILWDDIIEELHDAQLSVVSELNDYSLRDQYKLLRARNITLGFRYRYIPIMGMMREYSVGNTTFETPHDYFRYQPPEVQSNEKLPPRYMQHQQRLAARGQAPATDDYDDYEGLEIDPSDYV